MDCRTAHTIMAGRPDEPDKPAYQAHLAACAACRDDASDRLATALLSLSAAPAQPPEDFTSRLLARLPGASPIELQRLAEQERWRVFRNTGVAVACVFAAALLTGTLLQPALSGSALGLFAEAARQIVVQAAVPLLVLLAGAALTAFLLRAAADRPTALRVYGGAAAAVVMLLLGVGTVLLNDRRALSQAAVAGDTATITQGIVVDGGRSGNVSSAWGDIDVNGAVQGNVASLLGKVVIDSGSVQGDVFAGTGEVAINAGDVAGTVFRGPQGLALSYVLGDSGTSSLPSAATRAATALIGSLVTLALAGLMMSLWPQLTLGASTLLPARPWLALGLGVLLSCLLALLALPLLALLALTVFGVLLVPLLLLAVHLPYVQGIAVVGQALGLRLSGAVSMASAVWGVAAQLLLVVGLALLSPIAGVLAFYVLGSLGLGACVMWRGTQGAIPIQPRTTRGE